MGKLRKSEGEQSAPTAGGHVGEQVGSKSSVTRREFLKRAGIASAALTAGAGLGGVLAACGEETTTATTTAPVATSAPGDAATTGSATTVSASEEAGREVKLGFIAPLTGPYALAAVPARFVVKKWETFASDGVVLGDGKKHALKFELGDSQSMSAADSTWGMSQFSICGPPIC